MSTYLDFEKGVADLQGQIQELKAQARNNPELDIAEEVEQLEEKSAAQIVELYKKLTPWQKCLVARHADRPHAKDYIAKLFTEFTPMAGDRAFAEDFAVMGGRRGARPDTTATA
ncbi:MAG: hypothetical protein AAFV62_03835 [Pseudomonadota bacterium]